MRGEGWRTALAALLLAVIGVAAWRSIPAHHPRFPAEILLHNQRFLFWPQPSRIEGEIEFVSGAVRLQPGHRLVYESEKIQGLLAGSFQASSATAAKVEIVLVDWQGNRDVLVRRPLESAEAGRRFFLFDPRTYGNGYTLELAVAEDSPGAVDWREFRDVPPAALDLAPALHLPLVVYEGFTAPFPDGPIAYTHAPSQYLLAVPPGEMTLDIRFGFNAAVFAQREFASDGIVFQAVVEDAAGTQEPQTIWEQAVGPSEREAQPAVLLLPPGNARRLRLVVLPGALGNTAWDWAFWGSIHRVPLAP